MTTIILALLLAAPVQAGTTPAAQTFHVTSVRDWAPTDPAPSSHAFRWVVVTGTIGGTKYTTEQMLSFGAQRVTVGTDYPVLKIDGHAIKLRTQDRKGKDSDERLDIVGVEEVPK